MKNRPFLHYVTEAEGNIVGFIFSNAGGWEYGIPENIGWIDTIGLVPSNQKKVPELLMEEMVNYMKKVDVNTIYTFANWHEWGLI